MSSDDQTAIASMNSTRKRQIFRRITDANKKIRAQSYETGADCNCIRYQCFKKMSVQERAEIIKYFNMLGSWNNQSAYLTGLIGVVPIFGRNNRQEEENAISRNCSFFYKIRIKKATCSEEIPVRLKGFCAIQGITRRRVETIQNSLKLSLKAPTVGDFTPTVSKNFPRKL